MSAISRFNQLHSAQEAGESVERSWGSTRETWKGSWAQVATHPWCTFSLGSCLGGDAASPSHRDIPTEPSRREVCLLSWRPFPPARTGGGGGGGNHWGIGNLSPFSRVCFRTSSPGHRCPWVPCSSPQNQPARPSPRFLDF